MRRFSGFLAAAIVAAFPAVSFADAIEDAIKARQGFYQLVKANAGPLFGMAKGDVAYDAAQAQTFANNLLTLSQMDNSALWPAGSDKSAQPGKTRALPVAWETYPAIMDKHNAWKAAVADLAAVAGTDVDGLRSKIGDLGKSCKGCHDTYRAEDF